MADPRTEYRFDGRTDGADEKKQWSVKDMPFSARDMAVRSADAADQTVAEWLTAAILAYAGGSAPDSPRPSARTVDAIASIERLVTAAVALSTASPPPPNRIIRAVNRAINVELVKIAPPAARALPPPNDLHTQR